MSDVNFIAGVKDDISKMKLYTRKYFKKRSHGRIDDIVYRPQLLRGILNISFQLTPFRETAK